jgi:hypothetical protein
MIDAYTIGITLALDNGVAAGIASIRRDLAGLDAAVAVSTANMQRLRDLAATLPGLPTQNPQQSVAVPPRQSATSAARANDDPVPDPPIEPASAGGGSSSRNAADTSLPSPRTVTAPSSPVAVPRTPAPPKPVEPSPARRQPQSSAAQAPSSTPAAAPVGRPITAITTRSVIVSAATAPTAPVAATPNTTTTSPSRPPSATRPTAESKAAPTAAPKVPDRVKLPVAVSWRTDAAQSRPPAPASSGPAIVPSAAPAMQVSTGLALDRARVAAPSWAASPDRPSAAPVARQPDTGGSDIVALHLDGRVIGNMVADQLARAASMPPSSATGFDRRLTPAWTGLAP